MQMKLLYSFSVVMCTHRFFPCIFKGAEDLGEDAVPASHHFAYICDPFSIVWLQHAAPYTPSFDRPGISFFLFVFFPFHPFSLLGTEQVFW